MKISTEVLAVLSTLKVDGNTVAMPPLDRKLYEAVNKVLGEMGGKWSRSRKAHLFTADPTDAIDDAILTGEIRTAREDGFFPTPMHLAKQLVEMAGIRPEHRVLEPSAGTGRLVTAILHARPRFLVCVENDPGRAEGLKSLSVPGLVTVLPMNFLDLDPRVTTQFDRVCMNPPFSRGQDVAHVTHAYKFLAPGGILVAVMSAGVAFRQDKKTKAFREMFAVQGDAFVDLPEDSFAESGTGVRTVVVRMTKPVTVANVIGAAR